MDIKGLTRNKGNFGIASKKLILGTALFTGVVGGVYYWKQGDGLTHTTLRICTWSNYFPDDELRKFSDKSGVRLEVSYISSNEELFSKLRAGASGYDVIQPSDYMVQKMARLGMISPIDHSKLPNLAHIDDYYRNLPYDRGLKYSVPFTWGTTGIAINTAKVELPAGEISWAFLLQSAQPRHTSLLDDMREVFAAILKWKGYSNNTTETARLEEASRHISELKHTILAFSSEPKALLLRGEITIAHMYSSDAIQAGVENPKIRYFIPKEGATIWTDNFAIPITSNQKHEAHLFMDYFLNPENSVSLFRNHYLASPSRAVREKLEAKVRENEDLYPGPNVMKRLEFFKDLGESLRVMNQLWTELKS